MQLQAYSSINHQLSWQTSFHSAHKTWMSLSWVNDRVGGPCQPGAWTRALPTLQFTPSGQRGRGEGRKAEVDDRRNEAVTHVSAKTKGNAGKCFPADVTTETEALTMTYILVSAEILKNWARSLHPVRGSLCCLSIWMIIMLSWVKLCWQADTSLRPALGWKSSVNQKFSSQTEHTDTI